MRVVRCFAFLDLCGFTAYTEEQGDARAVEVLAQLRAVLRAEAEDKGVRVTKWLGDGAMLSGVEAASVLECVTTVRERVGVEGRLALRGGVCHGPVIMFEGDDYIGAPGEHRRAPVRRGGRGPDPRDLRHGDVRPAGPGDPAAARDPRPGPVGAGVGVRAHAAGARGGRPTAERDRRALTAEAGTAASRVTTLELFFDLVFVFTITQLTTALDAPHDAARAPRRSC